MIFMFFLSAMPVVVGLFAQSFNGQVSHFGFVLQNSFPSLTISA
jgi:hypothetical protein